MILISGEVRTSAKVDIQKLVRDKVKEIGYINSSYGIDYDTCGILVTLDDQSTDISMGVDSSLDTREGSIQQLGAGNQGIMFGLLVMKHIHICHYQ